MNKDVSDLAWTDLAKALDDEGGIRLHFSMGPEL